MTTTTRESAVIAHLRAVSERQQAQRTRTVNGQPTYRDAGTSQRYSVGYGVERAYERPAQERKPEWQASDAQKRLIDALLVERNYTALTTEQIDKIKLDKSQSSRFIKFLLGLPKIEAQPVVEVQEPVAPVRARLDFSAIKDGNYAVREESDRVRFYRVSTGSNGFKRVQERASDALFPVQGRGGIAILHKIMKAGLAESGLLFALELGRCCRCGRSLTDEESRANAKVNGGLGPDCVNL